MISKIVENNKQQILKQTAYRSITMQNINIFKQKNQHLYSISLDVFISFFKFSYLFDLLY